MQQAPTRYRFTVDNYYRMARTGILRPGDRVELIDGEVVRMSPIGVKHAAAVNKLAALFIRRLGDRAYVTNQTPVRLSLHSEPQPDLMLLVPGDERYEDTHPGPTDVLLLVEIADSSLSYDRSVKQKLYASAGIPEMWIIDVKRREVHVFFQPEPTGYAHSFTRRDDERVSPAAFPELALSLDDLHL